MYKSIVLLIALAHVARSSDDAAIADQSVKGNTCTGAPYGDAQPGDRYCVDDKTSRVCNWRGEWVEHKCDEGKCQVLPNDNKKVQCLVHNHIDYPTGPPPGFDTSGLVPVGSAGVRRRRAMEADNKAKEAAKPTQNDQAAPAAPTQNDHAAPAAAPAPSDTCKGAPYGDAQPGDRYCVNDNTNRVCNWGGEWVEFQCEEGSKCQTLPHDNKKVQCFKLIRNSVQYATGPPGGQEADQPQPSANNAKPETAGASGARRRRDDAAAASTAAAATPAAPATKSDTCTGAPYGSAQPGDRYCVDKKKHRVCNWGGEWVDDTCPDDFECMTLPNDNKKVQCFKFIRNAVPYATGPPAGQEADQPQPQAQSSSSYSNAQVDSPRAQPAAPQEPQSQPQTQPQTQSQPQPQPQSHSQSAPSSNTQPAEHPSNPEKGAREHHDCQGGPTGTLKAGETFCTGETTYKQCHDGQLIEDRCPEPAKCIKAKDVNQIICREIRRNANTQDQQQPNDTRRRF